MGDAQGTYLLLYDGECRICTTLARWLKALDVRGRIRIRAIQESQGLLGSLTLEEALGAMHAVAPDGRVVTGGPGLLAILSALLGGPALEALLSASPPVRSGMARLYGLLTALRARLTCRPEPSAWAPGALAPR